MSEKPLERGDLALVFVFIAAPLSFVVYRLFFRLLAFIPVMMRNPLAPKIFWALSAISVLGAIYWLFQKWNSHITEMVETVKKSDKTIFLGEA